MNTHLCIKFTLTQYFSLPDPNIFSILSSVNILFWVPGPLLKKKSILYCIFELSEAYTTRIHQKTVQKLPKKAKNTATDTNIFPHYQKHEVYTGV